MQCGKATWFIIFAVLGVASAELSLTGTFERNFGWKVQVPWRTIKGSTGLKLHNITIWRNGQEIVIYKPQEDGQLLKKNITSDNYIGNITCSIQVADQVGNCSIWLNVTHNATDDEYKAQTQWAVLGKQETAEENVFDMATKPLIRETQKPGHHQVLNCSSEGVPAPKLVWTVGEGNRTREIPADFNRTSWNATSKLWQSWSVYKPTTAKQIAVFCTPHQVTRRAQSKVGSKERHLINFNAALKFDSSLFLTTIMMAVAYYICA